MGCLNDRLLGWRSERQRDGRHGLSQNAYGCRTVGVDPQIDPSRTARCGVNDGPMRASAPATFCAVQGPAPPKMASYVQKNVIKR